MLRFFVSRVTSVFLLAWAIGAPCQTIYQSKGSNGVPVYSDRPPADGKIERTFVYEYLPSSPLRPAVKDDVAVSRQSESVRRASTATTAIASAADIGNVILYGTSWCPYCRGARTYLAQHGIGYQEIDIDTPSGRHAYDMAGGRAGVPLMIVGNRRVQGFSKKGYDTIFASR
jgi:glutaredoxin